MKYILLPLLILLAPGTASAYSVLTHEAIIDVAWKETIVPLLKQKYPATTAKELEDARAFAYGGAIMPDMGYYPFGNRLFSDLVHYVRNGEFVTALRDEASNVKEYAFALGALAHYNADRYGHSLGVNPAVPIVFPELREKYGRAATYEQDPISHIRTEFGFDVLQTARGNYVPDAYHRFISFEVADSLLKRAFLRNYGLSIDSLFKNYPRSVRTFRWAVKDIFPQLTRQAWKSKRSELRKMQPGATARRFHYRMRRAEFYKSYGREIEHTGVGARFVAFLMRIVPKIGPLKALKPALPGPEAERLFISSFDTVSFHYRQELARRDGAALPNIDFDTGHPSELSEYHLADKAYYDLLMALQERHFTALAPGMKEHILKFYAGWNNKSGSAEPEHWPEIQQALQELKRAGMAAN